MKKKISIFLGIFLLILITLTIKSYAGYFSNDPVVTSGGTVTITVSSNETLQNYDLELTNYAGLTYKGCSSGSESAAVNSSSGKISYATLGSGTNTLGTYTFTAPVVTEKTTYKVQFNVNGTQNTSVVTVNPKATEQIPTPSTGDNTSTTTPSTSTTSTEKSSVATLSNLGIRPNDFSGFRANTFSYSIEVPNEIEKIEVYANPAKGQEDKQKISGTGTKILEEGLNAFEVVVTAEAGNTKKYTISVTRKAKEETIEEENTEEQEEDVNSEEEPMGESFGLAELNIEGLELAPQFQTDVYEYKIELKENLEKLKITTLATKANSNIEITGNENLQEGENIITIIVKGENDAETVAYQIIVNKTLEKQEEPSNQEQQEKMKKIIMVAAVVGVVFIIVIVVVVIKIKKSKELNDGYIPYGSLMNGYEDDDETEEQTIEDAQEEFYEEEPKKKKRSKGKRFK